MDVFKNSNLGIVHEKSFTTFQLEAILKEARIKITGDFPSKTKGVLEELNKY